MAGDDGRLIFFADLRSDVVEAFREDENDFERTVVALAIEEKDVVSWDNVDWQKYMTDPQALERDHGPGRPELAYEVVLLDSEGRVVEDLWAGDLAEAKSHIDRYRGAVWEASPWMRK